MNTENSLTSQIVWHTGILHSIRRFTAVFTGWPNCDLLIILSEQNVSRHITTYVCTYVFPPIFFYQICARFYWGATTFFMAFLSCNFSLGLASLRAINLEFNKLKEIPSPSISMTHLHLANNNITKIKGNDFIMIN